MSSNSLHPVAGSQLLLPQQLTSRYPTGSWLRSCTISVAWHFPSTSTSRNTTSQTLSLKTPIPPSEMTQEDHAKAIEDFKQQILRAIEENPQQNLQQQLQSYHLEHYKELYSKEFKKLQELEEKGVSAFLLDKCREVASKIFDQIHEKRPIIDSVGIELEYVTSENRNHLLKDNMHISPENLLVASPQQAELP